MTTFMNVRPMRLLVLAAVLAGGVACNTNDLLTVDDPAVAYPENLNNANAIPNLYLGAVGDFQVAWSGNGLSDAFNAVTGLFTDEFRSSDTFITRNDADRRSQTSPANGNVGDIPYVALHRARRSSEVGADVIARLGTAGDPRGAELLSLAGYAYIAFGEGFCSQVPAPKSTEALTFPDAPGLTTQQLFDTAKARFTSAQAFIASNTSAAANARRNLARVGLGRALLNQGDYAGAAAAVSAVPTLFVYRNEHSANTPRQENSIWNLNGSNRRYTVSDVEGGNGLNFRSANDPRVPWIPQRTASGAQRNGFDNATPLFEQLVFSSRDADVPLADGVEARLIQAEYLLSIGNATWLDTLNALRANVQGIMSARLDNYQTNLANSSVTTTTLAPLTDPGTPAARVDVLFRERAFWMYGTGHRLGDLRRLVRQYGRAANTVFPTGAWHKGGNYGDDVNLVVPFDEENNRQFNRAACVTTAA